MKKKNLHANSGNMVPLDVKILTLAINIPFSTILADTFHTTEHVGNSAASRP